MYFCTKLECLLDKAGKGNQGQIHILLQKSVIYGQKSFITMGLGEIKTDMTLLLNGFT